MYIFFCVCENLKFVWIYYEFVYLLWNVEFVVIVVIMVSDLLVGVFLKLFMI